MPLSQSVAESLLSIVKNATQHKIYINNFFFTTSGHFVRLTESNTFAMGTVRENRMSKCPIKNTKKINKMDQSAADWKFHKKNKIAVIR